MKAHETWRRAGHGSIEWSAMCEPLAAESMGAIAPGIRLLPKGPLPQPAELRATAAQGAHGQVPRSRLADDAIVLVVESGVSAIDELRLRGWRADDDAWRFDFQVLRRPDADLDPAPARMWICLTLELGDAHSCLRELGFAVTTEASVAEFRLRLVP